MRNKVAYFGVFTAFAMIISYIETMIPFGFGIPGIKLGLTNIVVVMMLYYMGAGAALVLNVARIVLTGFLFGNLYSILYSLAGCFASLLVMLLCKKSKGFSIVGISMIGGVSHNIGQMLIAIFVVETWSIGYYLPVLLIAGAVTGFFIGIVSREVVKRLPRLL